MTEINAGKFLSVLVTGSTGFLGSGIVETLMVKGFTENVLALCKEYRVKKLVYISWLPT